VIADVEIYHLESREALLFSNITIVEAGPIRAALRAEVKLANSTFVTTVSEPYLGTQTHLIVLSDIP
jgi:hypothetical protein